MPTRRVISRTAPPARRNRHASRRPVRRAFTFVEAIAASVLLAVVASIVMSGISAIATGQERGVLTLNCAELANRLAIQWLDDSEARPPEIIPLAGNDYRWELVEERLDIDGAFAESPNARTRPLALARRITVTVWLHTGPETYAAPGPGPRFTLKRYLHLLSSRNPDSSEWQFENEQLRQRLFQAVDGERDDTTNTREERINRGRDPSGGGR